MSVNDAEPGDIYADHNGKLWRIIAITHQPTITAEEVEGTLHDPNAPLPPNVGAGGIFWAGGMTPRATIQKARRTGGIGGLMWSDWTRIWRNKPHTPATTERGP